MAFIRIESIEDRRLDPYRQLRTRNLTRYSQRFIAESRPLVQRLLESTYQTESVLVDEQYVDEASTWIPPEIDTLLVPHDWVEELLGFHFHRGFLGCGIRKQQPRVAETLQQARHHEAWTGLLAVGVQDPENLGVLLRNAAAFGIQDCFLGPGTADPLSRRVLRVSMGTAFKLRLIEATDLSELFETLRENRVDSIATSLQEPSESLESFRRTGPSLVLMGNEAFGLPEEVQKMATYRLKIGMELGTDSLNVGVAAGIVMHYLVRISATS